jgi:hypothetical protein
MVDCESVCGHSEEPRSVLPEHDGVLQHSTLAPPGQGLVRLSLHDAEYLVKNDQCLLFMPSVTDMDSIGPLNLDLDLDLDPDRIGTGSVFGSGSVMISIWFWILIRISISKIWIQASKNFPQNNMIKLKKFYL